MSGIVPYPGVLDRKKRKKSGAQTTLVSPCFLTALCAQLPQNSCHCGFSASMGNPQTVRKSTLHLYVVLMRHFVTALGKAAQENITFPLLLPCLFASNSEKYGKKERSLMGPCFYPVQIPHLPFSHEQAKRAIFFMYIYYIHLP